MTKNLARTVIIFMMLSLIVAWFIKPDPSEFIRDNTKIINLQKDLKKSLKNQIKYVKSLNEAFDKTTEMAEEMER